MSARVWVYFRRIHHSPFTRARIGDGFVASTNHVAAYADAWGPSEHYSVCWPSCTIVPAPPVDSAIDEHT